MTKYKGTYERNEICLASTEPKASLFDGKVLYFDEARLGAETAAARPQALTPLIMRK